MKPATKYVIVIVGLCLGGLIFKDSIQTALFDRAEFVSCFEDEVISEFQSQNLGIGKLTSGLAASMLGPQVRSNGNQIADFVKKNGLQETLEGSIEDSNKARQARFDEWDATGEMPKKDTFAILSEAEEVCLKRQVFW
jgi:hypothetical protein